MTYSGRGIGIYAADLLPDLLIALLSFDGLARLSLLLLMCFMCP